MAPAHPRNPASPSTATALSSRNEKHPKQPVGMKYPHVQRLELPAIKPPAPRLSPWPSPRGRAPRQGLHPYVHTSDGGHHHHQHWNRGVFTACQGCWQSQDTHVTHGSSGIKPGMLGDPRTIQRAASRAVVVSMATPAVPSITHSDPLSAERCWNGAGAANSCSLAGRAPRAVQGPLRRERSCSHWIVLPGLQLL